MYIRILSDCVHQSRDADGVNPSNLDDRNFLLYLRYHLLMSIGRSNRSDLDVRVGDGSVRALGFNVCWSTGASRTVTASSTEVALGLVCGECAV